MGGLDFHFRCTQPACNGLQNKYSFNGSYIYIKMSKLEQITSTVINGSNEEGGRVIAYGIYDEYVIS